MDNTDLKILIDDLVLNQNFLNYYELKSYLQKYDNNITGDDMEYYYSYYDNEFLKSFNCLSCDLLFPFEYFPSLIFSLKRLIILS